MDGHLNEHVAGSGVHQLELVHASHAVFQANTLLHGCADAGLHRAGNLHQVGLGHLVGGVGEAVRQFTVVGQQQQTLGFDVQAAHVEHALAHGGTQEVRDAGATFGVFHGGDHAGGLVECHVDELVVGLNGHAVHLHGHLGGVHAHTQLGHDFTVNGDAAFGNHFFADAAGCHTGLSQQLLQAHAVVVVELVVVYRGVAGAAGAVRASVVADAVFAALVCEGFTGAVGAARCAAFALGQFGTAASTCAACAELLLAKLLLAKLLVTELLLAEALCAALACAALRCAGTTAACGCALSAGLTALTGTSSAGTATAGVLGATGCRAAAAGGVSICHGVLLFSVV